MTDESTPKAPGLNPSGLGQYVKHHRCPRYLKQRFDAGDEPDAREWKEAYSVMNLALFGHGQQFEATQVEALARQATKVIGPDPDTVSGPIPDIEFDEIWAEAPDASATQLRQAVRETMALDDPDSERPWILLYQAPLTGEIGGHAVGGDADVIALAPMIKASRRQDTPAQDENEPKREPSHRDTQLAPHHTPDSPGTQAVARVIDIKNATDQRASHRVQVAAYTRLFEQTLTVDSLDDCCRIEAGVLTQDEAVPAGDSISPFELPAFDRPEWELLVEQLLAPDGTLDETLAQQLDDLAFSIDHICTNCRYREACMVRAIEDCTGPGSLAALGLSPAVQEALADCDITNIRDLSTLLPRQPYAGPDDDPLELQLSPDRRQALETALPGPIHETVQRAQAIRGEIDPEYDPFLVPPYITGKGWVPLPDDRVHKWGKLQDSSPGELIRVALYVRPDTAINRITALGACVAADGYDEPITIGELTDAVPDDPSIGDAVERDLFERFITELFAAIEEVARALETPRNAVIHCYTYTAHEQAALVERLDHHTDTGLVRAFRDLLSLRAGGHTDVDQSIIDAVRPIVSEHFALRYPSQGLLAVVKQFDFDWSDKALDPENIRPDDPSLNAIFDYHFLDDHVAVVEAEDGIRAHLRGGTIEDDPAIDADGSDGKYPVRKRAGAQIPIEYLWAVTPKRPDDDTPRLTPAVIDDWDLDEEHEALYRLEINRFRYRNTATEDPITRDDVEYLIERLSYTLNHLVESIPFKNTYLPKTPLDATSLATFELGPMSLPATARDYLRIEHGARRATTIEHYRQPLRTRLQTGRSVPVRCTNYEVTDDGLRIHGQLAYEAVFDDPDTAAAIARRSRVRSADGPGGGSWRLLTPLARTSPALDTDTDGADANRDGLTERFTEADVSILADIKHSPPVIIDALDQETGEITLQAFGHRFEQHGSPFRVDHCGWRCGSASNLDDPDLPASERDGHVAYRPPVEVAVGEYFVLDPVVDDLSAPKADAALTPDTVTHNALWNHLDRLATAGVTTYSTEFSPDRVEPFLAAVQAAEDCLTPNDDQAAFVSDVAHTVVPLQGPPGTGKTSGATAMALLARAYAKNPDDPFFGLVIAPSHTAVDTVLDHVVTRLAELRAATDLLGELELVRVRPTEPTESQGATDRDTDTVEVTECSYYSESGRATLERLATTYANPQQRLDDPGGCLLFATPSTLSHVLKRVAETLDDIEQDSAPAAMRYAPGLFDVLCVDEASMVDLPRLLLAGSALKPGGQTLLVGDHRQLATITEHDWPAETRRPIQATKPYLSALDYVRELNASRTDDERRPLTRSTEPDREPANDSGGGATSWRKGESDD